MLLTRLTVRCLFIRSNSTFVVSDLLFNDRPLLQLHISLLTFCLLSVGQDNEDLRALYQVGIIVWIFVGLSLVSAVLADVGDYYTEKVSKSEEKWEEHRGSKRSKYAMEKNGSAQEMR